MGEPIMFSFGFSDSHIDPVYQTKEVLGGKGFGLSVMSNNGMPVPPGFIFPTKYSQEYGKMDNDLARNTMVNKLTDHFVDHGYKQLHKFFGYGPLLSVRSGAPVSMPGMMDTILNVGLNDDTIYGWVKDIGERAAWDSYRRLIQMLGSTAYGIPMEAFDKAMHDLKKSAGAASDADLTAVDFRHLVDKYKNVFKAAVQYEFPQDTREQLSAAIGAVMDSWNSPRAVEYRKINHIDASMGTAVNIQSMVFGNMNDKSATGVLFSRNPSTGMPGMYGEFLINAQGEDVVAGIRTPIPIANMQDMDALEYDRELWQAVYAELTVLCEELEEVYNDMVDIEFTVQDGNLFVLQSRVGKRSALAAFQIAYDKWSDKSWDTGAVFENLTVSQFKLVSRKVVDPSFKGAADIVGIPASPGVATGKVVFTAQQAVEEAKHGPVILVTHETTPDDIAGMNAAVGILTQTGGATSHAAVVARAMDKPCVVGCTALEIQGTLIGTNGKQSNVSEITICGASGRVWWGSDVPVVDASKSSAVAGIVALAAEGEDDVYPVLMDPDPTEPVFAMSMAHMLLSDDFDEQAVRLSEALDNECQILVDACTVQEVFGEVAGGLFRVFGAPEDISDRIEKMVTIMSGHKNVGNILMLAYDKKMIDLAKSSGLNTCIAAENLNEFLTGSFTFASDEFISNVLGGEEAYKWLLEAMSKSGVVKKSAPRPVHLRNALFKKLAGAV